MNNTQTLTLVSSFGTQVPHAAECGPIRAEPGRAGPGRGQPSARFLSFDDPPLYSHRNDRTLARMARSGRACLRTPAGRTRPSSTEISPLTFLSERAARVGSLEALEQAGRFIKGRVGGCGANADVPKHPLVLDCAGN